MPAITNPSVSISTQPAGEQSQIALLSLLNDISNRLKAVDLDPKVMKEWELEIESLKSRTENSPTLIALCGGSGSGKSSLINAILDDYIVPTSEWRACTAVVTKISYHPSPVISADIEYLTRDEWIEDLDMNLQFLLDPDRRPSSSSEEEKKIWSKISTVYPTLTRGQVKSATVDDLLSQFQDVTDVLGTTKSIESSNSIEFQKALKRMVTEEKLGPGHAKQSQLWPLIRQVQIRCNAACLSEGCVLVDLPGNSDSNATRNAIARRYLEHCDLIWIIAQIQRAVDDKIAHDLLGEKFKTQLIMDGRVCSQSNLTTFIGTKCDDVDVDGIMTDLDLQEHGWIVKADCKRQELLRIKKEQERILRESLSFSTKIEQAVLTKEAELSASRAKLLSSNFKQETNTQSLKRKLDDSGDAFLSPKRLRLSVEAVAAAEAELHAEAESLSLAPEESPEEALLTEAIKMEEQEILEMNNKIQEQKILRAEAVVAIEQYSSQLETLRLEIRSFCARKRSEVAREQIKEDFRQLLRDADLDAGGSQTNLEEFDLPMFTVSSRDYMFLSGRKEGRAECFTNIEDTQIPAMRAWIGSLTRSAVERNRDALLMGITSLAQSIITFCQNSELDIPDTERDLFRARWESSLCWQPDTDNAQGLCNHLMKEFSPMVDEVVSKLQDAFKSGLESHARAGARLAAKDAVKIHDELASSMQWQAYKALISHRGSFKDDNLNENLTLPLSRHIAGRWASIFNTDFFKNVESLTLEAIEKVFKDMSESTTSSVLKTQVETYRKTLLRSSRDCMRSMGSVLNQHLNDQQKRISRELSPYLYDRLKPAYDNASKERGAGSVERRKLTLRGFLSREKEMIFDGAVNVLMDSLYQIAEEVKEKLLANLLKISRKAELSLSPLWDPQAPANQAVTIQTLRREILEEIAKKSLIQIDALVNVKKELD
ncbi:hypothetical protein GYMLUDRAFT_823303 [Collybiopsis luxurians FD-317 M1]|uniref:Nuclear GTPase SLIP-GC n=1 Tax=Collybiopsis luxurians FD-317 M1 TaxID=944289 RepID=A0A0D0BMG8_9AGAR|nr:hypothetical protein GYMLUDRAFT_823303 [Collybiopsis luxurians FD-317 M1]